MERNSLKEGPGLSVIIAKAQQQPVFVPQLPGLWQLIWALKGLQVMGKFFFLETRGLDSSCIGLGILIASNRNGFWLAKEK